MSDVSHILEGRGCRTAHTAAREGEGVTKSCNITFTVEYVGHRVLDSWSPTVSRFAELWRLCRRRANIKTDRCLSVVDLFFTGLCGLCNQRLFWLKSTWHKKTAAFLMSVANLRCQLVLTLHRQIWGHTGLGYIKISHQQHSSGGGRAWWEQGSPKVEQWLCVRAARTVTVRFTGQEAGPEQDGGKALQRVCALSLSVLIESG